MIIMELKKKLNMLISIYNDKITSNISITNKNFIKDVNKEIEYTNKVYDNNENYVLAC